MRKYLVKKQENPETGKQEETLFAEEILEDEVISKKVNAKIRERYSINTECEALRKGILNKQNKDFQDYSKYVIECQTWGSEQKEKANQDKLKWKNNFRLRNETEKEYISRIKSIIQLKETIDK